MGKGKKFGSESVTQTFTFFQYDTLAAGNLAEVQVSLTPTQAGLGSYSGQLNNFLDMYRLARVEHIRVESRVASSEAATASSQDSWLAWFLAYIPAGVTAPSNLLALETRHVSAIASGNVQNSANSAVLALSRADLVALAEASGPGSGWLATAADGPGTTWGDITAVTCTPAGTVGMAIASKISITMSFKDLVDPTLISERMKLRKGVSGQPQWPPCRKACDTCLDEPVEDLTMSRLRAQLKALSSK